MDTATVSAASGWDLYDVFLQGTNVYNGTTTLVATSGATWTACAIARSEIGTTGVYGPPTITNLPAGTYTREVRRRMGASAAQTDPLLYVNSSFGWDGSVGINLNEDVIAAAVWENAARTLTSGVVTVIRPWQTGSVEIVKGNSYLNADGTEFTITKSAGATWPSNLLSAGDYTITFTCAPTQKTTIDVPDAAGFSVTGAVVTATSVRLGDWTHALTNGLSIPRGNGSNAYTYTVVASRSAGTIVHTLEQGTLSVG